MPVAGSFNQLLTDTALGYLALGWSVIPLYGDASTDRPKVAAVAWEPFQRRRAREVEVNRWFEQFPVGGIGIVTGAVSQFAVLDFDDPTLLQAFERACPDLLATRTIITRRGQHLYFHLPPQLVIRSQKLDGIDLLAGGCYVVAPPSVIDGHEYTIGRGGRPKTLSQADLTHIEAFLDRTRIATRTGPSEVILAIPPVPTQEGAFSPQIQPLLSDVSPTVMPQPALLTADTLIRLYRGLASQNRRNVALFKASCLARDHGWSYAAVIEVLADVHAAQPDRGQHRPEKEKSRYREAIATIRSVFKRPARRVQSEDSQGLYNSIRERLFQIGQTCVVRVLEGLRLAGFNTGQRVSESDVVRALRGLVGRRSIRAALIALTPKDQPVFERISPRYPPRRSAAKQLRIGITTNASVSRSKRDKSLGRPSSTFRIPSLDALCQLLGVQPTTSDPITLDDLQSARQTRQAAHRELIRRRPGLYLRQWLADRLGVSEATVYRYSHTMDGLQVTPTYTATPIGWGSLSAIPAEEAQARGLLLEDDTGQRWPALQGIAKRLLGQGRRVRLLVQSLSYYAFGSADPPGLHVERTIDHRPQATHEPLLTFAQRIERFIRVVDVNTEPLTKSVCRTKSPPVPEGAGASFLPDSYAKPAKKKRRRHYWKSLERPENELLAQQVYTVVNARTTEASRKLSLTSARKLVDTYSAALVAQGLATLQRRQNVQQPAGWLSTWLRSSARG